MGSSPARTSASPCPSAHSATSKHSRRRNRRMRRELIVIAGAALLLSGCADLMPRKETRVPVQTPVIDRQAASAALISGYLENLQRLVQSAPAEQAEIAAAAQREYDMAPTPSHQLRLALVLATPNHAATDLPRAQRLLRELMAAPAALLPAERALAFLEQQKVDVQLALEAENKRLQGTVVRTDKDRNAAANKRLQAEIEENTRLKKELEE